MKKYFTSIFFATLSVCIIFLVDLLFSSGIAIGILYLVSMVLVVNERKRTLILFAAITSSLIIAEMLIHYEERLPYSAYGDMALSVAVIWISCPVLLKFRKQNKDRIQQEKRYHQMVDGLIEGAQIIGFDWKYIYVNDAAVMQSKFSREELLDHTMMERYPGIENSDLFKVMEHCMLSRKTEIFENEFKFPDGSSGYFLLSIQPVPEGVFVLSMDISEGKKREQNQKQYIKEMEEMIFMTSHKVRQPVAQILGISNLLENENSDTDLKTVQGYMKNAASSLDAFTRELTDFMHSAREKYRL